MGFEQPKIDTEGTPEDKEVPSREDEPSNVIEGPWPEREADSAEAPEELASRESMPERSNVIEGPWPKREQEPAEALEELAPDESAPERTADTERVRQELEELYDQREEPKPEPREPEEGGKERHRFSEGFEQYKRCEACGGKGRRWLFFLCPVCKGLGSVVASSSRREGYHEVDKKRGSSS